MLPTRANPQAVLDAIRAEQATRDLWEFTRLAWSVVQPDVPFQDSWHVGCLCEHLAALRDLEIQVLIINAPPRSLKSWLVSVLLFAWVWAEKPSDDFVYITYDERLGERDSVRARDLVKKGWYRHSFKVNWEIRSDMDTKAVFTNSRGGTRLTTTPISYGVGLDADWAVFDDPQGREDAKRPAKLQVANDFYDKVVSTRANNPATYRRLVNQQRLADNDLSGYLLGRDRGIPAVILPLHHNPKRHYATVAEAFASGEPHPIVPTPVQRRSETARDQRKAEGELLHAERYTPEVVAELEAALKDEAAAQLEQAPSPAGGDIFKKEHFRYFRVGGHENYGDRPCALLRLPDGTVKPVPLDRCIVFQTADTALTEKKRSSFTAVGTFLLTPDGELLVLHVFRAKIEVPYQYKTLQRLRRGPGRWDKLGRRLVPDGRRWPKAPVYMAVEPKASGIGLIQQAAADGRPFKPIKVDGKDDGDKVFRSGPLSTMYANGQVYHLEGAYWLREFEDELLRFPAGAHDDQCLAAGTPVRLRRGEVAIENVRPGDEAWTRGGWNTVTWAGPTGGVRWAHDPEPPGESLLEVEVAGDRLLRLTPNHPLWVMHGPGWTPASSVFPGDHVAVCGPALGDGTFGHPLAAAVTAVRPGGRGVVYNMTINSRHEYYAEGILCRNCDCASYAAYLAGRDAVLRAHLRFNLDAEDFGPASRKALKAEENSRRNSFELLLGGGRKLDLRLDEDELA